jgi:hypothetical protein
MKPAFNAKVETMLAAVDDITRSGPDVIEESWRMSSRASSSAAEP